MTDLTPITYADTAHTSEKFLWPRSEPCHHGKRFRLSAASGQQLPYRHPSEPLFPASELVNTRPKRLRELEQMPNHSPRPVDRPEHPLRWDEECLRYTSQTKINFIIGALRALGMVGFFLGLFVLCASLSLTLFFPSQGINLKEELILDFLTNGAIIGFFYFSGGGVLFIACFLALLQAISLAPCGNLIAAQAWLKYLPTQPRKVLPGRWRMNFLFMSLIVTCKALPRRKVLRNIT
ncbi:hypothetical protein ACFIOZ_17790 [Vreelandella sp. F11]|uniref:hypothetical protein n=1 Tax=Vreelandella sp. F11 TaxID=3394751 RepID=UPI0036DBF5C0